jgi:hypothetical protein
MTNNSSTVYTDKAKLFQAYLVPSGLLCEILVAAIFPSATYKREGLTRAKFAYDLFHTLNLASCYAINPENRDLSQLQTALNKFVVMVTQHMGQHGRSVVAKVDSLRALSGLLTSVQVNALLEALPLALSDISTAIGYDATKAQAWRDEQTRSATPLTRNGRINKWRTFARNTNWSQGLNALGLGPTKLMANPFGTRVGTELMPGLWRDTFSHIVQPAYTEPVESPVEVPALESVVPSVELSPSFRLPVGVTVNSTKDGRLSIVGTFDPTDFLNARQLAEIKKGLPSPELRKAVAPQTFEQICEFPALAETLESVQKWRAAQDANRPAVLSVYGQWRKAELEKAVEAKLKQHFNSEERGILLTLLTRNTATSVPATAGVSA